MPVQRAVSGTGTLCARACVRVCARARACVRVPAGLCACVRACALRARVTVCACVWRCVFGGVCSGMLIGDFDSETRGVRVETRMAPGTPKRGKKCPDLILPECTVN